MGMKMTESPMIPDPRSGVVYTVTMPMSREMMLTLINGKRVWASYPITVRPHQPAQ
jgi:hypothetical protein